MTTRDLTLVPTEHLPPEYAHVRFPAREYGLYQRMVRSGEITPAGSLREDRGTLYTTIRRNGPEPLHRAPAPDWIQPAVAIGVITGTVTGVTLLVAYLIRTLTSAVSQAAPLLGFLVACSLVLLGVAAVRRPRVVEGTFKATIR